LDGTEMKILNTQ